MLVNLNAGNPDAPPFGQTKFLMKLAQKYTFANQNVGSAIYGLTLGFEANIFENYKLYSDVNFTKVKIKKEQGHLHIYHQHLEKYCLKDMLENFN